MQPEPSRFIPLQVAPPQKRSRFAAFFAAIWAWLYPAREKEQTQRREYERSEVVPEPQQERAAPVETLNTGKKQGTAGLAARKPAPGVSRFLRTERSGFMTRKVVPPPEPFSRFYGMPAAGVLPVRSRFLAPLPEPRPPGALHSRFVPDTPAPVSKFIPPASGMTPPPEDDPPPPPPTIPPTRRKLHALWKTKNFRKPFP